MPAITATCLCHLSRNGTVALNVKAILFKSELVNSAKIFYPEKEKRCNDVFVEVTEGLCKTHMGNPGIIDHV